MDYMLTTPAWTFVVGFSAVLLFQGVTFAILLHRIEQTHATRMKQAVDLVVKHQEINQIIASEVKKTSTTTAEQVKQELITAATGVAKRAETAALDVRQKVIEEAAQVKAAVEGAQKELHSDVQKVEVVNTPLVVIPTSGNDRRGHIVPPSDEPPEVTVANTPKNPVPTIPPKKSK